MNAVPSFVGTVSDAGKVEMPPARRAQMEAYLRSFKGQEVSITIKRHRRKRSAGQNSWHWAVAVPLITAAADMDPNDPMDLARVHYGLVEQCFGKEMNEELGIEIPKVRSSQLTTEEFSYLMEWEVRWAAERGILVPMPDDLKGAA